MAEDRLFFGVGFEQDEVARGNSIAGKVFI